jgi:hypothetical protein
MRVGINVPEVLSASTLGAVAGIFTFASHERWAHLGRDAYLAHFARIYDTQAATHSLPLYVLIIMEILLALFVLAVFKGLAYLYDFLSDPHPTRKKTTVPPAKLLVERSRPE